MDLAKLISKSIRDAESGKDYKVHPRDAVLIEHAVQMFDPTTGRWHFVDMADHDSIIGYSYKEGLKRLEEVQQVQSLTGVRYRLVGIVEAIR